MGGAWVPAEPATGATEAGRFIWNHRRILVSDKERPKKQRHMAKRIFERLRDEHGYRGGSTIVKDYVRVQRLQHREVFVPLRHDPGHAQVDFGEALPLLSTAPVRTPRRNCAG